MKSRGPLLLLLCALLWGMGFVAQTSAADSMGSFSFTAARNFIGTGLLAAVIAVRKVSGLDRAPDAPGSGYDRRTLAIAGLACGLCYCLAANLQQAGITAYPPEAAASSRAGFLTSNYVVFVALIGVALGRRMRAALVAAVALTIAGMYLLCAPQGVSNIYMGDVLILGCALVYAVHIMCIDHFDMVDGVRLSQAQLFCSGCISLVCALVFEQPRLADLAAALVPVLYAGIASDGIAYTLQIIGQKTTDPTVASVIMNLETVFAAFGGWLILGERLSPMELAGSGLLLAAVVCAQLPERDGTT